MLDIKNLLVVIELILISHKVDSILRLKITASNGQTELHNIIINNRKISVNKNRKSPFETETVIRI